MDMVSLSNNINSVVDTISANTSQNSGKSSKGATNALSSLGIKDEYVPSSEPSETMDMYSADMNKCNNTKLFSTFKNTSIPTGVFNSFECKSEKVAAIVDNFEGVIDNYIGGNASIDDVKSCIKETYTNILNYNIGLGRTSGTNEEENAHILTSVYETLVRTTSMKCLSTNNNEGYAIAAGKGMTPQDHYVYYNSKYYHAFEDIKQATTEATKSIADEKGLTSFDVAKAQSTLPPTMGDFNEYWSGYMKNNSKMCVMNDTSIVPPQISLCSILRVPNMRTKCLREVTPAKLMTVN